MTTSIEKEIGFDAGHRVPGHVSKCKNPHGHRYRVIVTLGGDIIRTPGHPEEGMLTDFGFMKEVLMKKVHDVLDHGFIVWEQDAELYRALCDNDFGWKVILFPYVPTAENIARWISDEIEDDVYRAEQLWLVKVTVYETPTSMASYRP